MSAPEQQQTATTTSTLTREVVSYASIVGALRKGRVVTATISDPDGDRTLSVIRVMRVRWGLHSVVQCDDGMWWETGMWDDATWGTQTWRNVTVFAAMKRSKRS